MSNDLANRHDSVRSRAPVYEAEDGPQSSRQFQQASSAVFRPFVLPQTAYGPGQPYLRGYSQELSSYGITIEMMMSAMNKINVAIIPSPEVQIFRKMATIAGFFLPGVAHGIAALSLTAGQIVIGFGAAFGHIGLVTRVVIKQNATVFLPRGLELRQDDAPIVDQANEISIVPTKKLQDKVGGQPAPQDSYGAHPGDALFKYGDLVAPITEIQPQLQRIGRQDPIARLGNKMRQRKAVKKLKHAQKDLHKGKLKDVRKLEKGAYWIVVMEATPERLAAWRNKSKKSSDVVRSH